MFSEQAIDMIRAHIEVQMGGYFSEVAELGNGWKYVSSSHIDDEYWNYAVPATTEAVAVPSSAIQSYATSIGRPSAILAPSTDSDQDPEAWMLLEDVEAHVSAALVPSGFDLLTTEEPQDDVVAVFRNAYGSGGDPADPGYSQLPGTYIDALTDTSSTAVRRVTHTVLLSRGGPVALASVYRVGSQAGLYNVGVVHTHRRRGLGRAVSALAVAAALVDGVDVCFLQTPSGSPVEQLYAQLGFVTKFRATVSAV